MKVSQLEGMQLDYWVARALGYEHHGAVGVYEENDKGIPWCRFGMKNDWWKSPDGQWICGPCSCFPDNYSTEWLRGGPIIEQERIGLEYGGYVTNRWHARWETAFHSNSTQVVCGYGSTALIAAMRAFVASKFGEAVEQPDQAAEQS